MKAAKESGESEPPDAGERPTVIPPFDLASFARESMPPSVQNAQNAKGGGVAKAPPAPKDEEIPTIIPAKSGEDESEPEDLPTVIPPASVEDAFRSELTTSTNEDELERARQNSVLSFSSAPPGPGEARNSTVPAPETPPVTHAHSAPPGSFGRISALSLADMRLPTPPPMPAVVPPRKDKSADANVEVEITSVSSGKFKKAPAETRESSDPPPPSQVDPMIDMRDRFSLGDYSGALAIAEIILVKEPSNVEAAKMAEECQRVLIKMYAARIGPLDRVPMVMVQPHELRWLSIDHRAGFLLSLVDGMSSIEMILDVSGMPLLDTLRILHELYQQRVISFRS